MARQLRIQYEGAIYHLDGSGSGYLRTVCDYVHLNPARAKMLSRREGLQKYRWSSYRSYLAGKNTRETWLRCDRLLGEHGLIKESRQARLEFSRRMDSGAVEGARLDQIGLEGPAQK